MTEIDRLRQEARDHFDGAFALGIARSGAPEYQRACEALNRLLMLRARAHAHHVGAQWDDVEEAVQLTLLEVWNRHKAGGLAREGKGTIGEQTLRFSETILWSDSSSPPCMLKQVVYGRYTTKAISMDDCIGSGEANSGTLGDKLADPGGTPEDFVIAEESVGRKLKERAAIARRLYPQWDARLGDVTLTITSRQDEVLVGVRLYLRFRLYGLHESRRIVEYSTAIKGLRTQARTNLWASTAELIIKDFALDLPAEACLEAFPLAELVSGSAGQFRMTKAASDFLSSLLCGHTLDVQQNERNRASTYKLFKDGAAERLDDIRRQIMSGAGPTFDVFAIEPWVNYLRQRALEAHV